MTDQPERTRSSGNMRMLAIVALIAALGSVALAVTNLINLNTIAQDDSLRRALAEQMGNDPDLVSRLASSAEINELIRKTQLESIKEDPILQQVMLDQLLTSGELKSLVSQRSELAVDEFRASSGGSAGGSGRR